MNFILSSETKQSVRAYKSRSFSFAVWCSGGYSPSDLEVYTVHCNVSETYLFNLYSCRIKAVKRILRHSIFHPNASKAAYECPVNFFEKLICRQLVRFCTPAHNIGSYYERHEDNSRESDKSSLKREKILANVRPQRRLLDAMAMDELKIIYQTWFRRQEEFFPLPLAKQEGSTRTCSCLCQSVLDCFR